MKQMAKESLLAVGIAKAVTEFAKLHHRVLKPSEKLKATIV
jgi:hypothetical protein